MKDKKKVLVVDDSVVMRNMISDILTKGGFEITGLATNGLEALEMYRKLKPDIVTLDIIMPKEQGLETLKKVLKLDPKAKIIILSGLHQKTLLLEALNAGAKDYVVKPFTSKELTDAVKKNVT